MLKTTNLDCDDYLHIIAYLDMKYAFHDGIPMTHQTAYLIETMANA